MNIVRNHKSVGYYDIGEIQESLKEILESILIEELNFEDKCKLYKKIIFLYEELLDYDMDGVASLTKLCPRLMDIYKTFKKLLKLMQHITSENLCIELMKPSRVLNRISTYGEDYEYE